MATVPKIRSTAEAWESGELGRDEAHVKRAMDIEESVIDEALELQLISVRLQRSLIDSLKLIAKVHGIGYQPLMRQVLHRFVNGEMKRLLGELEANSAQHAARGQQRRPQVKEATDSMSVKHKKAA